jgi:hypothetical protein
MKSAEPSRIRRSVCRGLAAVLPILTFGVGLIGGAALRGPREPPAPAAEVARLPSSRAATTPTPAAPAAALTASECREKLKEVIAALPSRPPLPCDGVVNGIVRDEEERGVADVRIVAVPQSVPEAEGETIPEDAFAREIAAMARRVACRTETRTRGDGTFSLPVMTGAALVLTAEHEDFSIHLSHGDSFRNILSGTYVFFDAHRLFTVPVRVLLPDGSSPAKALIEDDMKRTWAWSPRQPFVRLRAGNCCLRATAEGDEKAPRLVSDRCVISVPRTANEPVTLALRENLAIRGRVIVPGETGVGACVRLKSGKESGDEPDHYEWGAEFSFEDNAPGTYRLEAGFTPFAVDAAATVVLVDRPVTQDLVLPRPAAGDYLTIWARDHRGRTLFDVTFGGRWSSLEDDHPEMRRELDGSCRILLGPNLELGSAAECSIFVTSRLNWQEDVDWKPGDPREITVSFKEPALLEFAVPGFPRDRPGAAVLFEFPGDWYGGFPGEFGDGCHILLNDDRPALVGFMKPGQYRIEAAGLEPYLFTMSPVPVGLVSGVNRLEFPYPRLCDVTVRGLEKDAEVRINPADGARFGKRDWSTADGEGRASFKELPAGDYDVTVATPAGEQSMRVSIDRTMEVEFGGMAVNGLRVEQDLEALGLLEGDSIVGCNGVCFTNERDIDRLGWLSQTITSAELIVRRGGTEITIPCELPEFLGAMDSMRRIRLD